MRHSLILAAILLSAAGTARAQVTVDLHALDGVPRRAAEAPPHRVVRPMPTPPPLAMARPAPSAVTEPHAAPPPAPGAASGVAASPAPPPATLPDAVPAVAVLAPVQAPSQAPGAAPPPPEAPAEAATASAASATGLRLTFAKDQSDLGPGSAESIKDLVRGAPTGDTTTFNVVAYAGAAADDASGARRMSLARAIAVRSALVADGVSSARIYMRALGAQPGDGPTDRVDLSVLGTNAGTIRSQ